jgi:hypothetical protein
MFLPTKLYARDCMDEIFNELIVSKEIRTIVIGSPGVGKSILAFVAALCYASFGKKEVLFLRKTSVFKELVSLFFIQAIEGKPGYVQVAFNRKISKKLTLRDIAEEVINQIMNVDIFVAQDTLKAICDGPKHDATPDLVQDLSADLVTSSGHPRVSDEAEPTTRMLPLSAWSGNEMKDGLKILRGVEAACAGKITDLVGVKIRPALRLLNRDGSIDDQRFRYHLETIEKLCCNVNAAQTELAYHSAKMSGDKDSVDSIRAMFGRKTETGYYDIVQYIASPYILRQLR